MTIKRNLAEDYRELIASLGHRPVVAVKTATLYGKVCGLYYEVTFTPQDPIFYMTRKATRQDPTKPRHRSRAITAAQPDQKRARAVHPGWLRPWGFPSQQVIHHDPQQSPLAGSV